MVSFEIPYDRLNKKECVFSMPFSDDYKKTLETIKMKLNAHQIHFGILCDNTENQIKIFVEQEKKYLVTTLLALN